MARLNRVKIDLFDQRRSELSRILVFNATVLFDIIMECGWYAYQSKSGETLFFFNKITGQYKWISCTCSKNLEPWVTDNVNALQAITSEVTEHDQAQNTGVHVRSIATETDLPAPQKTFNTQGTQTEWFDGISCTDDTLAQNVLSTIILKNSNHQKIFVGEESKPVLSRTNTVLQESNDNGKCRGKENCKLPSPSKETKQSYKVKLFECSYCEKAFTSYAFLVKHEKYHVENDSRNEVCDDLDAVRSEDSISSDLEVEPKKTYEDCKLANDVTEQASGASSLINTPMSSKRDSIPFFEACFQCGKSFTSADEFEAHLQEHLKVLYCNPCQKQYQTSRQFLKHITQCHITRRHNCHLCKCKYLFKNSLKGHLLHFHKVGNMEHQEKTKHKGTEYQCDECDRLYTVLSDLQKHKVQEHKLHDAQSTSSSPSNNSLDSVSPDSELQGKGTQRHWCNECNVSYIWLTDLVRHRIKKKCCLDRPLVQVNGNRQQFICRYDDRTFNDKKQFVEHYIKHFKRNKPPLRCDQCTRSFLTHESLEKHLAVHLEEVSKEAMSKGCPKPYSCEICGKSFGKRSNHKRHVRRNHRKKKGNATEKFSCDTCNKMFNHRSSLLSHKKTHLLQSKSIPEEEKVQATETTTTPEVQNKQKRPEAETATTPPQPAAEVNAKDDSTFRQYKCGHCHKRFFNLESLSRHKKLLNHGEVLHLRSSHVVKTEVERPQIIYHCNVCQKSFKYYNVFYKHRSAHKGEKKCKICGKMFKSRALLSGNMCSSCKKAPHKAIKDFCTCKVCGKEFLDSRSLKDHRKAHNDGSLDCKTCNIAFSSADRLKKHLKNHKTEVRNLKNFKHSREKLQECNKCKRFYAGRKNLVRHRVRCMKNENDQTQNSPVKKSEKKIQNYSCQKCHKSFTQFNKFSIHCAEHGEEKPCCKCLRFLSSASSVKRHLTEQHAHEHTFYCHMCPEEFYDLNGLINHTTLVPGVRRHKCEECGQAFALCNRLMEHVKHCRQQK